MTDEEMAEEYVNNNGFGSDCNNLTSYEANQSIEQAYLAGLNASRPKWHKVADGDLPPEDTDVLALLADKEIYMAHFYRRNVWDKIGPVIAWCEIPQYTEE